MAERDNDIDEYFSSARVAARQEDVLLTGDSYRSHLFDHDDPMLLRSRGMGYEEFSADKRRPAFVQDLLASWQALYDEPFVGVTSDGTVRTDVHHLPEGRPDDPALQGAAETLLEALGPEQREQLCYPVDAPQWRAWSNPEFVVHRVGLRLEELGADAAEAVMGLLATALSPRGYERVREAMALNGYLGELVDLPAIMNDRSYWISLFGDPSSGQPWGFQLFGHHLALNFVSVGSRHVIAPVFIGAEPALSDGARPPIFAAREQTAIELAASFTDEQRARAVVYDSVLDPEMPPGRVHPADERHLAGAFRDNRVIPYEGICASELTEEQWSLLLDVVEDFLLLLVDSQRRTTLAEVAAHRGETWFCWYGAIDGSTPFYFRVQSPVVLGELDHHAGVWLTNRLPARFHVHTTLRLPNGNDYGRAYISQWRQRHGLAGD